MSFYFKKNIHSGSPDGPKVVAVEMNVEAIGKNNTRWSFDALLSIIFTDMLGISVATILEIQSCNQSAFLPD